MAMVVDPAKYATLNLSRGHSAGSRLVQFWKGATLRHVAHVGTRMALGSPRAGTPVTLADGHMNVSSALIVAATSAGSKGAASPPARPAPATRPFPVVRLGGAPAQLSRLPPSSTKRVSNSSKYVDLSREFSNFSPSAKTLARRLSRGVYRHCRRPAEPRIRDSRGPLVRSIGMAQTFLDAAQVDELVTMYRDGKTMREVAEHFGVHRTTVAIHLRRRSVPVRRGKLSAAQVAEIGALYDQGFTLAEIGVRFDVGQDTARR